MFKNITIFAILALLSSCDKDPSDDALVAEEANPFSYTWSHPECPFTVDFPGDPNVEEHKNSLGKPELIVKFEIKEVTYSFYCNVDIIQVVKEREKYTDYQLAEEFSKLMSDNEIITQSKKMKIDDTEFKHLKNAIMVLSQYGESNDNKVFSSGVVFIKSDTLAFTTYHTQMADDNLGKLFIKLTKSKSVFEE